MANFCKQCSIETFGKDFGDMANIRLDSTESDRFVVLCEGCTLQNTWATIVNTIGECVVNCNLHHGNEDLENFNSFFRP